MTAMYEIADEPPPSRADAWAMDPFWPLLTVMLGGALFGATLFAINTLILRGPTRRKEISVALAMVLGGPILLFGLIVLGMAGFVAPAARPYLVLIIVTWKLSLAYWLFFLQQVPHALNEYFSSQSGGARSMRLGPAAVFLSAVLKSGLVGLSSNPFWITAVS